MDYLKLYTLLCCLLLAPISFAQIPVGPVIDPSLIGSNTIVSLAEGVTNFLLKKERPLQENINDIHKAPIHNVKSPPKNTTLLALKFLNANFI